MYEVLCIVLIGIIMYLFYQRSDSRPPVHLDRRDYEEPSSFKAGITESSNNRNAHKGIRKKVARHIVIHTNQNTYKIDDIHIPNVVSLELLTACVPRGQFKIDTHNQYFEYEYQRQNAELVRHSVTIDIGSHHSAATLALELGHKTHLDFTYDARTSTYYIKGGTPPDTPPCNEPSFVVQFRILFGTGTNSKYSCARELGFERKDTPLCTNVASDHRSDLSGPRFIQVRCRELDATQNRGMLGQLAVGESSIITYQPGRVEARQLHQPITLKSLSLDLVNFDPSATTSHILPYNLNGLYYSLTLRVECIETMYYAQAESEETRIDVRELYT